MVELYFLYNEYKTVDANKEPLRKCRLAIRIIKLGGKVDYGK